MSDPNNPDTRELERGVMLDLYWRLIRSSIPEEGTRLNVAYAIARHLGLDCPMAKVIVHDPSACTNGDPNLDFGERYGVDWEFADALGRRLDDLLAVKQESPITGWGTLVDVGLSAASVYDIPTSACAMKDPSDQSKPIDMSISRLRAAIENAQMVTGFTSERLAHVMSPPPPTSGDSISVKPCGSSELAACLDALADRLERDNQERVGILHRLEL